MRRVDGLLLAGIDDVGFGRHLRQAIEHLTFQFMNDQPTAKVTQVRMRNLRKVHRKPQRMLPTQIKLESVDRLPVADIFMSLKQQDSCHQRGRMRRAAFPLGVHLGEVLVPKQARADFVENREHRVRINLAGHLRRNVHQVPLILTLAHHGPGNWPV